MKYVNIGKTDISVSKICVGCMSFGVPSERYPWTIDQESATAIVKTALEQGINFFDTANIYSAGTSEEFLGKALKNNVKRDKVIISSKVCKNEGKLSREAIHHEIDGTLKRLGTDYLDIYIIHRFDYDHPIEETMEALNDLVTAGKVRSLGASAMFAYQFYNMQNVAKENHWARFEIMQNHYNLLYREEEREMIPLCKQMEVTLMPYSPLASGHLCRSSWDSDSKRSLTDPMLRQKYEHAKVQNMPIIETLAALAQKRNLPMSQLALAWLWAKGADTPVLGITKDKYLLDAVAALEIDLHDTEINQLEENYRAHEIVGPLKGSAWD